MVYFWVNTITIITMSFFLKENDLKKIPIFFSTLSCNSLQALFIAVCLCYDGFPKYKKKGN